MSRYAIEAGPLVLEIDDTRFERKIHRVNGRFATLDQVFGGPVQQIVREAIAEQFDSEGGYSGDQWEDLAVSTQFDRMRSRHNILPDHPILVRSGRLERALTKKGARGAYTRVTRKMLEIGTKGIDYAAAHQRGSDHSNLPARPILPDPEAGVFYPDSFYERLRNTVRGYLIESVLA